jgi:hypothetical protein
LELDNAVWSNVSGRVSEYQYELLTQVAIRYWQTVISVSDKHEIHRIISFFQAQQAQQAV